MWKALFIVNPKSGAKKNIDLHQLISKNAGSNLLYKILIWEHPEQDLESIVDNEIKNGYNLIVAVGGDGTVNRIGKILINKDAVLGIIPLGSGNGLARFLKIPLDTSLAIRKLAEAKVKIIDSCTIAEHPFFCTAGVGFDAYISHLFASNTERGFWAYVKIISKSIITYRPKEYVLTIDDNKKTVKANTVTFANANQWGNNAIIAPGADIADGIINITIVKPFIKIIAIVLAIRLVLGIIHKSRHVETTTAQRISVTANTPIYLHFDGEPLVLDSQLDISINPLSLKVAI